jgi:hypothetical protein
VRLPPLSRQFTLCGRCQLSAKKLPYAPQQKDASPLRLLTHYFVGKCQDRRRQCESKRSRRLKPRRQKPTTSFEHNGYSFDDVRLQSTHSICNGHKLKLTDSHLDPLDRSAAIGDGDTMGIARQVSQHLRRPTQRFFGVDDQSAVAHGLKNAANANYCVQNSDRHDRMAGKPQSAEAPYGKCRIGRDGSTLDWLATDRQTLGFHLGRSQLFIPLRCVTDVR